MKYGLSGLMEAMKQSETAEAALEAELSLMESVADDEVKRLILGDDTVENDMEGNGIGEEERKKLEDFIKKIPESTDNMNIYDDEELEEEIEETMSLLEACSKEMEEDDNE